MASSTRSDMALPDRRAGFGPTADALDRAADGGSEAAVEHLLSGPGDRPDPVPGGRPDKKAHPNGNFAREVMELSAQGIGNYAQDDVIAGGRVFRRLGLQPGPAPIPVPAGRVAGVAHFLGVDSWGSTTARGTAPGGR